MNTLRTELGPLHAKVGGLGLEVGLDISAVTATPAKLMSAVHETCHKNGLHLAPSDENVIQLMPPCNINQKDLELGINILVDAVKKHANTN
jgi:4-aminobutyrate aminotransferase-like enzyme